MPLLTTTTTASINDEFDDGSDGRHRAVRLVGGASAKSEHAKGVAKGEVNRIDYTTLDSVALHSMAWHATT